MTIAPNTEEFALIDLEDYYTGYPVLEISGGKGATVSWSWAESLFDEISPAPKKSDRNEIEGKLFNGMEDIFHADGSESRQSIPWWRSGRYCLICVKTGAEELSIKRLAVEETGYPFGMEASFKADCPELEGIIKICERVMHACSHETFMDCPYYEQLMYVGDTRLEMLTMGAMTTDERLVKRCVELFDHSRVNWGFVNERYPALRPQHSPTFSLIWTLMLHDFAFWRNTDEKWLEQRMVGLRAMMEHFNPYVNEDGLLDQLPGWPFMDWTAEWKTGTPSGGYDGISSSINLLYAYSLQKAAELEKSAGDKVLAKRALAKSKAVIKAVLAKFWCAKRQMIADDREKTMFSEHSQALAILCGAVKGAKAKELLRRLLEEENLIRASSYFTFYLFEAFKVLGHAELILPRLDMWREMLRLGFKTTPEEPRPGTRSDCHAWSAQIFFHLQASIAGIRPSAPGFKSVRIEPMTGNLLQVSAELPHPSGGLIKLALKDGAAKVELPKGLSGTFVWKGKEHPLKPGVQHFT